eukprot:gene514-320_t
MVMLVRVLSSLVGVAAIQSSNTSFEQHAPEEQTMTREDFWPAEDWDEQYQRCCCEPLCSPICRERLCNDCKNAPCNFCYRTTVCCGFWAFCPMPCISVWLGEDALAAWRGEPGSVMDTPYSCSCKCATSICCPLWWPFWLLWCPCSFCRYAKHDPQFFKWMQVNLSILVSNVAMASTAIRMDLTAANTPSTMADATYCDGPILVGPNTFEECSIVHGDVEISSELTGDVNVNDYLPNVWLIDGSFVLASSNVERLTFDSLQTVMTTNFEDAFVIFQNDFLESVSFANLENAGVPVRIQRNALLTAANFDHL